MQLKIPRLLMVSACLVLAACATGPKGVRITNGGTSATSAQQGEAIRDLSSADVGQRIVGKTFQYTRSTGNGFITYNSDGTFDFQDDTKGAGKGRWSISGTQFCEMFGEKAQQECGTFRTTGDAYFAANTRLVEMKI